MREKKRTILVVLCITAVIVYFSIPYPILGNYKNVEVWRVELVTDSFDCRGTVDLAEQVDCDEILQILNNYSRSRIPRSVSPQQMRKGDIEISLRDDSKSFHIYLSPSDKNSNYIYQSADRGGYSIRNAAALQKEIVPLLPIEYR